MKLLTLFFCALLSMNTAMAADDASSKTQSALDSIINFGNDVGLGGGGFDDDLLPPDEAFQLGYEVKDAHTISFWWQIADGYYLYKDKFKFSVKDNSTTTIGAAAIPGGKKKHDEYFGDIEVFYHDAKAELPINTRPDGATEISLIVGFQGCADIGVCYPPIRKTISVAIPAIDTAATPVKTASTSPAPVSEQDKVAQLLNNGSLLLILSSMFGFGLLLAFTACVYPMIPILSSLIVGQGEETTPTKSFILSLVYVEAVAITYAVIGVASAMLGAGVQAFFQNPFILAGFAAIFVALALSMFGFFSLQLPSGLQAKLGQLSHKQKGGHLINVAIMGVLSALIIGPCAGPVLIGALIYTAQSGDYVLGGLALFALGNGMGAPLLVIGASGGKLLPKAGGWMDTVKAFFGVVLLAVAILILERLLPGQVSLLLWALWFIIPGVYLGALEPVAEGSSGFRRLFKGLGLTMILYGIILLVGVATGGHNVLRPLDQLSQQDNNATTQSVSSHKTAFKRIKTIDDLQYELKQAASTNTPVMLDFYADWCTYCIVYEDTVFSHPNVRKALEGVHLIQADVTDNDDDDKALLNHVGAFAPPMIIFFDGDGIEQRDYRVVGEMNANEFSAHLSKIFN